MISLTETCKFNLSLMCLTKSEKNGTKLNFILIEIKEILNKLEANEDLLAKYKINWWIIFIFNDINLFY